MIKNKSTELCDKCGQAIEPLAGKSVKQTVVPCETCSKGKKVEHTFEHIDCSTVKIYEIPKSKMFISYEIEEKEEEDKDYEKNKPIEDRIDENE